MKKSIMTICLVLAMSTVLVGCNNSSKDELKEPPINLEINNSGDESNMNENLESGEEQKVSEVTVQPKELEPTPAEELVTEEVAMANAKADANKYANIEKNPVVTMVMKDLGTITMELYPKTAPESVENFISLINKGVYDGLVFHRTIPGFMAQGGDPLGNGTGGPDYGVVGEFSANGIENNLSHTRGILSMARSQENNSAGSQFFIVTTDSTYLDGNYAAFGKVLEGMDVVDEIVNTEVLLREEEINFNSIESIEDYIEVMGKVDRPVNPPVIEKVTVDTFGVTYDEPEKIAQS